MLRPPCPEMVADCHFAKGRQSLTNEQQSKLRCGLKHPSPPFIATDTQYSLVQNISANPAQPTRVWFSSQSGSAMGWPEALASDCLCVHLNFAGEGRLTLPGGRDFLLRAQTLAFSRGITAAIRTTSRDRHECLTLCYPHTWLADHLREAGSQLTGQAQRLISAPFDPMVAQGRPLKPDDQTWARTLMAPHLCIAARKLMEGARLTDFLISELFSSSPSDEPQENIMTRAERAALDRVEKVKTEVLRHLDDDHTLEDLARVASCSPHYLSRTFAQVTGQPLMLWIRRAKIDRAAELIATGRCNVSEAALEVGYRSFSHFSRAFGEEKGISPSKWVSHLSAQNKVR